MFANLSLTVQARAHSLLRQKEADLAKTRQESVQQFQEELALAEAATQAARQQLEQVLPLLHHNPVSSHVITIHTVLSDVLQPC